VRNLLGKSGIAPEALPPEEDIKELERRLKSTEKQVLKDTKRLGKKVYHRIRMIFEAKALTQPRPAVVNLVP
jgi:hypothetical protein